MTDVNLDLSILNGHEPHSPGLNYHIPSRSIDTYYGKGSLRMLVPCQIIIVPAYLRRYKVAFTEVVPDQLCSCLDLNKTTEAKVKGVYMCGSVGKSVDLYSTNSCSHLCLSLLQSSF